MAGERLRHVSKGKDLDETVEHVLWECRRFEEKRKEFPGEDAVEDVRFDLKEVIKDGCEKAKLLQIMKRIGRRTEMEEKENSEGG